MTNRKKLVALAIVGTLGFTGTALAEKNGSNANSIAEEKEGVSICSLLPWLCVTTQGNGGGTDPIKPKPNGNS